MKVPHSDVSIGAAGEADLGVRADGQCVAGWSRGSELCLYAGRLWGQVPDGQCAGLATHDQGAAVRQQLAGADIIVPVLERKQKESVVMILMSGYFIVILRNIYVNRMIWGQVCGAAYFSVSMSRQFSTETQEQLFFDMWSFLNTAHSLWCYSEDVDVSL